VLRRTVEHGRVDYGAFVALALASNGWWRREFEAVTLIESVGGGNEVAGELLMIRADGFGLEEIRARKWT